MAQFSCTELKKREILIAMFLTIFIGLLGVGVIIPVTAPIILNTTSKVLPPATTFAVRSVILGLLIASYSVAQFFGAPMLGTLADRYGRKKMLLISQLGTVAAYIIFAIGILTGHLWMLFVGRLTDGFTGGNISIAQSIISDISEPEERARNFGLVGVAFGIGFILGPAMGGLLANPGVVPWFGPSTPFWFATGLTAVATLLVQLLIPETLCHPSARRVNVFAGVANVRKAFTYPNLRAFFSIVFLMTLGWNFFTQFFQVFLIAKFKFDAARIGLFLGYMGVWIVIAQGGLLRPVSRRWLPDQVLRVALLFSGLSLPFLLIPRQAGWLYAVVPFVAVFQGLSQPNATAIAAGLATIEEQGEILGINQSITSLGQAVPPIVAGIITSININLPIAVGATATLLAWAGFMVLCARNKACSEATTASR
jgi:DHA1 family tetracycline resistance protein-like MFS transporter